ncbi:MAG: YgiT-type zinc finger protein [Pseudomonadota bacterium]
MKSEFPEEVLVEKRVTYTLEIDGRFVIVENVPARVNVETGERFFSPETVEQLQKAVWQQKKPSRVIETLVFEFAA